MKKTLKYIALFFSISLLIISYTGCGNKTEPVSKDSYYMDTVCTITIYDMENMSDENALGVIDEAFSLCADYEDMISVTRENSDIYKINHAGGKPVECDPHTIAVVKMGIEAGERSGGAFDITIGKVTDLWDFQGENPSVPDKEKIEESLKDVNFRQIKINGNTITMEDPEGEINLGGIGKGYIADRAADLLKEKGVTSAIVNFGGNIVVVGDKMGEPFKIGVELPYSDRSEIAGYVEASDATLVTSGIYERYFEEDGVKYHHILDVETGYPADTDVVSVTIIAPFGYSGVSDGLSTTCLLLGSEKGMELIENFEGVEAVFQTKDGKLLKTKGVDNFTEQ